MMKMNDLKKVLHVEKLIEGIVAGAMTSQQMNTAYSNVSDWRQNIHNKQSLS